MCNSRRNTENNTTAPPSTARRCTLRLCVKLLRTYHDRGLSHEQEGEKKGILNSVAKKDSIDMTWPSRLDTSPSQQRLPFENIAAFAVIGVAFQDWRQKMQENHGPTKHVCEPLLFVPGNLLYVFCYFCLFNHVHELRVASAFIMPCCWA